MSTNESVAERPAPGHPGALGVQDFSAYAVVIDARSPHEYAEDHIPGAVNLPVVDDDEFAQVGIQHKTDKHAAYLIGVEYSLRNIADQIGPLISRYTPRDRFLVYCFRGGKRSRLWTDNLRIIGFQVDQLAGGWKAYRRWVREALDTLPRSFTYRVLCGPTGCGKTRVLHELRRQGEQVLELEGIARHRGSLLGADALFEAMHRSPVITIDAPMSERVRLWREDYPHFAEDPMAMVSKLEPLKPLVGKETLDHWRTLASEGRVDELFESIMVRHYDPCYERSTRRNYGDAVDGERLELTSLGGEALTTAVTALVARVAAE